jgi:hypothetical protein
VESVEKLEERNVLIKRVEYKIEEEEREPDGGGFSFFLLLF